MTHTYNVPFPAPHLRPADFLSWPQTPTARACQRRQAWASEGQRQTTRGCRAPVDDDADCPRAHRGICRRCSNV